MKTFLIEIRNPSQLGARWREIGQNDELALAINTARRERPAGCEARVWSFDEFGAVFEINCQGKEIKQIAQATA